MTEAALINPGRVEETIADHPHALRQCGFDGIAHVVAAGSGEQERLGFCAERLRYTREQYVPDHFGPGRAAGFAREQYAGARRLKAIRQQRRMGRLARAFAAFEGHESSTHRVLTDEQGRTESAVVAAARYPSSACSFYPFVFRYSRLKPARKRPSTSSLAASKARCGIEPASTLSAACSGTSSTTDWPRHTFSVPIFWPCCTGAGTGPE